MSPPHRLLMQYQAAAAKEILRHSQSRICCAPTGFYSSASFVSSSSAETTTKSFVRSNYSTGTAAETIVFHPHHQLFQQKRRTIPLRNTFVVATASGPVFFSNYNRKAATLDGSGRRGFATSDDTNDDINDDANNYTRLLTKATAKQMKGDIPEAIALTSKALLILRITKSANDDAGNDAGVVDEEIADASVFLGKLLMQPDAQKGRGRIKALEDAAQSFEEARAIFGGFRGTANRKKECAALCQLASAQAQMTGMEKWAEANYLTALKGLTEAVGWRDGMTNHTAFQLAKLYREQGDYKLALSTLARMKEELALVFGATDSKVLQLNGELAELWQLVGHGGDDSDSHDDETNDGEGEDEKKPTRTPDETAVALLEEALDSMPSNSPEYMSIFMRLEDLKEQIELATESGGSIGGGGSSSSKDMGGVTVTRTTASKVGR